MKPTTGKGKESVEDIIDTNAKHVPPSQAIPDFQRY